MKSHRRKRRRGNSLVFFAMFLFGLMAMAALVIDIGFARLTQRQMQAAADAAAVEGLRGEDVLADYERLERARNVVAWYFDDDLNATNGDDGAFDSGVGQFGAGPRVTFSGGAGDPSLVASQLMEVDPSNPVYKPELLAGSPSATGHFQVALRRGATDVPTADLYANGPAVSYLFARGSLIDRDLIASGITVRGTGVAVYRAALSVGIEDSTNGLVGLTGFALQFTDDLINMSSPHFFTIDPAAAMPVCVGRTLPASTEMPSDGFSAQGYAPLYAVLSSSSNTRIVGFVNASVTVTGNIATVTLADDQRSLENASSVICHLQEASLTGSDLNEALEINRRLPISLLTAAQGD